MDYSQHTIILPVNPVSYHTVNTLCIILTPKGQSQRFTFVPLDYASEVSDLLQDFLHPKTPQSHV